MNRRHSILVVALALALCAGCVSTEEYKAATTEVDNQDTVIRKLKEENERLRADYAAIKNRYDLAQADLVKLRGNENLRSELTSLYEKLKALESMSNVTVAQRGDGTALTVEGSVLFKTGSDDISDKGREILQEIADKIRGLPNNVRVEGHTDDVPVQKLLGKYPKGNLQLSGQRALNVADFLINQGQVERARICFGGYGAERPVTENDSNDGKAKNRRVEIVVLNPI
jgi:chemotaxis protein MotB